MFRLHPLKMKFPMWGLLCLLVVMPWCAMLTVPVHGQTKKAPKKAAEPTKDERIADLKQDLKQAEEWLAADDLATFFEEFLPIEDVRQIRKQGPVSRTVQQLKSRPDGKQLMELLAKMMKRAQLGKIELTENNTQAVVSFTMEDPKPEEAKKGPPPKPKLPDVPGLGSDLTAALKQAAKLLQDKKYQEFALKFYPQTESQILQSKEQWDEVVLVLQEYPELTDAMLEDLTAAAKAKPKMEGADTARFDLPKTGKRPARTIEFQKVNGNWRLPGDTAELREEIAKVEGEVRPFGPETFTLEFERWGKHWRLLKFNPRDFSQN